jgi:hypothetical protein
MVNRFIAHALRARNVRIRAAAASRAGAFLKKQILTTGPVRAAISING